jgi:hypothetical protein
LPDIDGADNDDFFSWGTEPMCSHDMRVLSQYISWFQQCSYWYSVLSSTYKQRFSTVHM